MTTSPILKAGLVGTLAAAAAFTLGGSAAEAHDGLPIVNVPNANPRSGIQNTVLTPSATQTSVAWGNLSLSNPDVANGVTHYGYNTLDGAPLTQSAGEAHKTEPDKNVYLVLAGHHFLFQGHELGPRGYVTRVDLDEADPQKRVTLVSDVDASGQPYPTIDGITWDPFSHQLLLTAESGAPKGGVFAVGLDAGGDPRDGGRATRLDALGSGGFEGIQNDAAGNVWLVEDIGGAAASGGKVPNSFVYRFVPKDRTDLTRGGRLQALQISRRNGMPATSAQLQANPSDAFITALHTYGTSFATRWVTIHDGTAAFDATAAARVANATPLKRPENGVFRPGTNFREFYFTETGDTSTSSTLPGAYGGVFRLSQRSSSADTGRISIAVVGDVQHTGLDNITFATVDDLLVVEDAGDGLHAQRDALDSGYAYRLPAGRDDHGRYAGSRAHAPQPVRFLAEGRDASATFDAAGGPSYNDGDNEITGIHVSDGDPGVGGLLGAKVPQPTTSPAWRTFWTQQHGDNTTWEIHWNGAPQH